MNNDIVWYRLYSYFTVSLILSGITYTFRYHPYCSVSSILFGITHTVQYHPYCTVLPILFGITHIVRYHSHSSRTNPIPGGPHYPQYTPIAWRPPKNPQFTPPPQRGHLPPRIFCLKQNLDIIIIIKISPFAS